MDINNIGRQNFNFTGIYRGVVEDNADPLDAGRVRIRIYNIHNTDGKETSIDDLPWARPALGLSWSGGYNNNNKDHTNQQPDVLGERYDPGDNSKISGTNKTISQTPVANSQKFSAETQDPYYNAYGTGGEFVVPKRGNWLYVFFEGQSHEFPVYFAMATVARDWTSQKTWRTNEIQAKITQINGFRNEFDPRSKATPAEDSWASNAIVNALVDVPALDIPVIDQSDSNRDITCTTSPQGTTIVFDNRYGKERIYVIHKNFIDFTDESGNKKIYAGMARGANPPTSLDPNTPSNYEIGVEGNHELFVRGDYNIYTKGDINIQVDGNAQIDVENNVGIVSRKGDIDLIVADGNINASVAGNVDMNVGNNANIRVEKDANILVEQDLSITVNGKTNATIQGDCNIEVEGSLNATIQGSAKINAVQTLEITCPDTRISGNISIGGNLNLSGDANIGGNAKVQQVVYAVIGMDCGGYIYNRGIADLGGPVTLHNVIVLAGSGRGTGQTPARATSPTTPTLPSTTQQETGIRVDKSTLENATTLNEQ
jgi:hypothetical protein